MITRTFLSRLSFRRLVFHLVLGGVLWIGMLSTALADSLDSSLTNQTPSTSSNTPQPTTPAPLPANWYRGLPGNWEGSIHTDVSGDNRCYTETVSSDLQIKLQILDRHCSSDDCWGSFQGTMSYGPPTHVVFHDRCFGPDTNNASMKLLYPGPFQFTGTVQIYPKQGIVKMAYPSTNYDLQLTEQFDHPYLTEAPHRAPEHWGVQTQYDFHIVNPSLTGFQLNGQDTITLSGSSRVAQYQGSFMRGSTRSSRENSHIPPGPLATLLGALGLLVIGAIMNPSASKFVAGFGGLVGLTEALGGIGLDTIAKQGRLGGFVGAAVAEGIELARTYQNSTAVGESASATATRIGISFGTDLGGFVAGIVIMEAAGGVVATATGVVGTAGAVIVALGGAAVLTYGVSAAGDALKGWANTQVSQWLGK